MPVYALLVPPKPYDRYRHDNRAWWAAAMNRFYWGADGIYLFNLFPTQPDERFSQLGSVDTLKGRDKIYAIDNPAQEDVLGTFKLVMVGPNRLPITLVPNNPATAKLPVGEDIVANTPTGKTVSTLLRLRIAGLVQGDRIEVTFNGHSLAARGPRQASDHNALKRMVPHRNRPQTGKGRLQPHRRATEHAAFHRKPGRLGCT